MKRALYLGVAVCVCSTSLLAQISAVDVCNSIAQNAVKDISVSTGTDSSTSALYSNYCYADGSTNDSAINASGNAVVQGLPIGAAFASSDKATRFKQFCTTFQTAMAQSTATYNYQSLVVSKALDSVVECLKAANNGYALSYRLITPSTMVLNFAIPPAGTLTIQGIQTDPGVTCAGADLAHPGQTLTYGPGKGQKIDSGNGANAVTCSRSSVGAVNGAAMYSEKAVVVSTSQGALDVFWPQDGTVPLLTASKIQASIDDLTKKVTDAKSAIAYNALPIGSIVPWFVANGNPPPGWTKCDGSDTAHCPNLNGMFLRGTVPASVGATGGSATSPEHQFGSNNRHPDGNGWSMDGAHFWSNDNPHVDIIPPYVAVLYIMKIANQ